MLSSCTSNGLSQLSVVVGNLLGEWAIRRSLRGPPSQPSSISERDHSPPSAASSQDGLVDSWIALLRGRLGDKGSNETILLRGLLAPLVRGVTAEISQVDNDDMTTDSGSQSTGEPRCRLVTSSEDDEGADFGALLCALMLSLVEPPPSLKEGSDAPGLIQSLQAELLEQLLEMVADGGDEEQTHDKIGDVWQVAVCAGVVQLFILGRGEREGSLGPCGEERMERLTVDVAVALRVSLAGSPHHSSANAATSQQPESAWEAYSPNVLPARGTSAHHESLLFEETAADALFLTPATTTHTTPTPVNSLQQLLHDIKQRVMMLNVDAVTIVSYLVECLGDPTVERAAAENVQLSSSDRRSVVSRAHLRSLRTFHNAYPEANRVVAGLITNRIECARRHIPTAQPSSSSAKISGKKRCRPCVVHSSASDPRFRPHNNALTVVGETEIPLRGISTPAPLVFNSTLSTPSTHIQSGSAGQRGIRKTGVSATPHSTSSSLAIPVPFDEYLLSAISQATSGDHNQPPEQSGSQCSSSISRMNANAPSQVDDNIQHSQRGSQQPSQSSTTTTSTSSSRCNPGAPQQSLHVGRITLSSISTAGSISGSATVTKVPNLSPTLSAGTATYHSGSQLFDVASQVLLATDDGLSQMAPSPASLGGGWVGSTAATEQLLSFLRQAGGGCSSSGAPSQAPPPNGGSSSINVGKDPHGSSSGMRGSGTTPTTTTATSGSGGPRWSEEGGRVSSLIGSCCVASTRQSTHRSSHSSDDHVPNPLTARVDATQPPEATNAAPLVPIAGYSAPQLEEGGGVVLPRSELVNRLRDAEGCIRLLGAQLRDSQRQQRQLAASVSHLQGWLEETWEGMRLSTIAVLEHLQHQQRSSGSSEL